MWLSSPSRRIGAVVARTRQRDRDLGEQIGRALSSVALNIAEGSGASSARSRTVSVAMHEAVTTTPSVVCPPAPEVAPVHAAAPITLAVQRRPIVHVPRRASPPPRATTPRARGALLVRPVGGLRRRCAVADVLIVDDDEDILEALAELVESEGHHVCVAHDGIEGLKCLDTGRVDLILLDVEMPRLTGPQMAYEIFVRDAGAEKIPIVLLSGRLGLDRIASAIGTPYFLPKPSTAEQLCASIERALTERTPPHPMLPTLPEPAPQPAG
jgi:CheY-like chemotaxis protein